MLWFLPGAVCDAVAGVCQNNGTCMGDIDRQICDCSGTGYHGPTCVLPGEGEFIKTGQCSYTRNLITHHSPMINVTSLISGYTLTSGGGAGYPLDSDPPAPPAPPDALAMGVERRPVGPI